MKISFQARLLIKKGDTPLLNGIISFANSAGNEVSIDTLSTLIHR